MGELCRAISTNAPTSKRGGIIDRNEFIEEWGKSIEGWSSVGIISRILLSIMARLVIAISKRISKHVTILRKIDYGISNINYVSGMESIVTKAVIKS